ncbi:MAG: ABC transporter permease [Bacteroidota bacterium]
MIDWDKWEEIFGSIRRHPVRTTLTGIAVAWGIFMLVILLGMSQGLQNGIEFQFSGDNTNSIWIRPGRTSMPYKGLKEGRRIRVDNNDFEHLLEEFPEITYLSGEYGPGGDRIVKYKQKALSFQLQSVHPAAKFVENIIMEQGRFLNELDQKEARKVAIVGQTVQDKLFPKGVSAVGESITIDGVTYRVVGVYTDNEGEYSMRRVYIPVSTSQQVYSAYDRLNRMFMAADDLSIDRMMALEQGLRETFATRKSYDINDRRAFRFNNFAEEYQNFQNLMTAIKSLMWIVGIFSIIAGVIGVSNIMLIIVKDRTKEIGIRKAIGATPRSIVGMIFQEAILITAVSGYIGLGAGVAVMAALSGVTTEFFRNPQVNLWIAISATFVLIFAGGLAGLLPALQASRINPVKAIKSD